jgi:glycosyltransferase involved in cell wall biosynthesis
MKVLIISSWFPFPPNNGSKLRAFHLVSRLVERHAVTLLSFVKPDDDSDAAPLRKICRDVRVVDGSPYAPQSHLSAARLLSGVPRSYAQTYSARMQRLVDAAVPEHDCAVALGIGATLYLRRHSSIARVFEEAEAGVVRNQYQLQSNNLRRIRRRLTWWKLGRFLRELVAEFDRTTVVSEVEYRHLADACCDTSAIRVLPNGVDRADLVRPNSPRPGRLIYPGSVTYSANLDAVRYFLGDIFPTIRAARPDTSFFVTGAIGDVDVRAFTETGAVTFTGCVPDIARLIGHSAVCVVPLRIGGGTRLKILQSMALGTPVVTTTKGAEGLDVTAEENILIADSPSDFSRQVQRVLNDFVLRARLASNARRLVERAYTWDRVGRQLDHVIQEAQEVWRDRHLAGRPKLADDSAAALV